MSDKHESEERVEKPEFIPKQQLVDYLASQVNGWDFDNKTDKENLWFSFNAIRWVTEYFGSQSWSRFRDVYEAEVKGEELPEALRTFAVKMTDKGISYNEKNIIDCRSYTEGDVIQDGQTDSDIAKKYVEDHEPIEKLVYNPNAKKPKMLVYDIAKVSLDLGDKGFEFTLSDQSVELSFSCRLGPNRDVLNFVISNENNVSLLCNCAVNLALLSAKNYRFSGNWHGEMPAEAPGVLQDWLDGKAKPSKKLDENFYHEKLGSGYLFLKMKLLQGLVTVDDEDFIER